MDIGMIGQNFIKDDENKYGWIEKFIDDSRNGTIFHRPSFLDYHGERYKTHYLITPKIVFPYVIGDLGEIMSHPGASYGGPVISRECKYIHLRNFITHLLRMSPKITMRLPPSIYYKCPCDDIDYALVESDFRVEYELSSAVCIDCSIPYDSDTSRSLSKAEKSELHITIESGDDLDHEILGSEFYYGLVENLKRHKTSPTHKLMDLLILSRKFPKDILFFMVRNIDYEAIAGSMLMRCNHLAMHTFYLWQNYKYQEIRPMNYLVNRMISYCRKEGYRYLNLGISNEGDSLNLGLLNFKEGFGARGILRKTYKRGRIAHV